MPLKHLTNKNWFPIHDSTPVYGEHLNAVIDVLNDITDGTSTFDTISEKTSGAGVTISSVLKVDHVTESTSAHGVVIEGILLKDNGITVSASATDGLLVSGATTAGVHITGSSTNAIDIETGTFATGIRIAGTTTNGLIIGTCGTNAISLTGNNTKGIVLNGNNAVGIDISGTYSSASSKAITSKITINAVNLGDGVGANEFELTITGTSTSTAASSSWVNILTGTATGLVCAQTNGVYEEVAGTISGATIIFGMRMQSLCTDAPGESYPFSCVSNTNVITAIFQCNDASSDLGRITNVGVDSGTLVPLYKDNTGVKYVKIYTHT